MSRLFISFIIIFFASLIRLSAQGAQEDVVYLNDSSVIRGEIVENVPGEYIKLRTQDGSIWVFRYDAIAKLTREDRDPVIKKKGYYNVTELGFLVGQDQWGLTVAFSFNTVNGHRFSPKFATGVSTGFDIYNDVMIFPVALDVRGRLFNTPASPFYFGQAGYGFATEMEPRTSYKGGVTWHAGGGMEFRTGKNYSFQVGIGHKYQRAERTRENWGGGTTRTEMQLRRISFRLGIVF
ncbi:MAG: hypothetical protein M3Q97_06070 [Bacteroidota bacterium]|nr:hypothetical protein [Bacteroidota bacterium]